jgi:hypothetical protein
MAVTGKGGYPFRSSWLRWPDSLRPSIAWGDTDAAEAAIWSDLLFQASAAQHLLTAAIAVAGSTPDASLTVNRTLLSHMPAASLTADAALQVARLLAASIPSAASTPDVALSVLRALAANAASGSFTADINLQVALVLAAAMIVSSHTPDPAVTVQRDFSAQISCDTITDDVSMDVLISVTVAIALHSATPDADLIVASLGDIQAPSMISLSIIRVVSPVSARRHLLYMTPLREILSKTPMQTIASI